MSRMRPGPQIADFRDGDNRDSGPGSRDFPILSPMFSAYKINGEKAVHLNPRPQLKDVKSSKAKVGGTCCQVCRRHIQDLPNRFCSIACKVSTDAEIITMNNQSHKIISTKVGQLPNLEQEESSNNYHENGYASSSIESSSEVIQTWLSSATLRPNKMLRKRKSLPKRAPMC
ncbi:hypothetical protein OROMI_009816 [Orobanche minor]